MEKEYIKIKELKNNYLYEIKARNANRGIWLENEKGFIISRFKFGSNFTFIEYHWDNGPPFGTVRPIKEIEKCPVNVSSNKEILEYLNNFEKTRCDLCGRYKTDWIRHDDNCPNRIKT
jgi:hypothetical protein